MTSDGRDDFKICGPISAQFVSKETGEARLVIKSRLKVMAQVRHVQPNLSIYNPYVRLQNQKICPQTLKSSLPPRD